MYTNTQAILVLDGQVLNIKIAVKKDWHTELRERLWRDEIATAILNAKQRRPRCSAEAHTDLLS